MPAGEPRRKREHWAHETRPGPGRGARLLAFVAALLSPRSGCAPRCSCRWCWPCRATPSPPTSSRRARSARRARRLRARPQHRRRRHRRPRDPAFLGLDRDVWAIFLAGVTSPPACAASDGQAPLSLPSRAPCAVRGGPRVFLAGAIAAMAIASAGNGLRDAQAKIHFTDFWLLPDGRSGADDNPHGRPAQPRGPAEPLHAGTHPRDESLSPAGAEAARRAEVGTELPVRDAPGGCRSSPSSAAKGSYRSLDLTPPR